MSNKMLQALVDNPDTLCFLEVRIKGRPLKGVNSENIASFQKHGNSVYVTNDYRMVDTFTNLSALAKKLSESKEYRVYDFYICPIVPLNIEVKVSIEINSFK